MGEDKELVCAVLTRLDQGMWDEWDVGLSEGLRAGFWDDEIRLAARSGWMLQEYLDTNLDTQDRQESQESSPEHHTKDS